MTRRTPKHRFVNLIIVKEGSASKNENNEFNEQFLDESFRKENNYKKRTQQYSLHHLTKLSEEKQET